MSEIFVNSGEDPNSFSTPIPNLQGLFLPGIDNPLATDGFGVVIPWGGGSTIRKYTDYGYTPGGNTQLNDLASAFIPAEGKGWADFNLSGIVGLQGIQGVPGRDGLDGIITVMGLNLPQNSNFLTTLPHDIDQINQLGTAVDKLIYTDTYSTFTELVWTERQPAGDANKNWECMASDSDGSNLLVGVDIGRLYTSDDSGATWTERQPAGASDKQWVAAASDSDGSHLIAGVNNGRLYTSANSGVNWTERQPAGASNEQWVAAASDSDGSHLIAAANGGGLFTSDDSGATWTERQPTGAPNEWWWAVASDLDGTNLIAAISGKRLYTSADSGVTWTERQPAGASDEWWNCVASDDDGSHLMAGVVGGRLYTSDDSGATWTERQPAGDANKSWYEAASDSDGSHLIAAISNGRLYISSDFGVTWGEEQPAGDFDKKWHGVAIDSDGTNYIVGVDGGRLYTGIDTTLYSEATWAESALTSAGRAILDDATAAAQATTLGLGTGDAVTHDTLTLSSIAAEGSDVDKFLVDSTGDIKYRTGAEVLSDIGASASAHLHDTQTLQHDAVNSDGGAFSFTTTGTVTFSQSIASSGLTQGSVLFAGASGVISQDNSNIFWDDTNDRLGIGTASPEVDFHIKNSGGEAQLLLQSLATTDATIRLRNGSSSKWTFGNDASNDEFIISTGSILGTPKLTILQSGYVGIGTGATAPNAPLEVKGSLPGSIGGFTSGHLHVTGDGSTEFSGSVITGHNSFNTNTQLWRLGSTSESSHNDIAFINRQNAKMHFKTNNVNRVTIDAAGNVTLAVIAAEGSDVDKFLVSSTGVIKYRTGAQVLSDIGGQTQGAILDDLNSLGVPASDGQFIVATGAGVFQYEATTVVRTSLGLGTGDSPQVTGIELGHVSDTTIARASAGDVNIEGNIVYRAGGTDVPIADGGTGQGTAQAAIDALSAVSGATNEHVLTKDTGTGNAIFKAAVTGVTTWIGLTDTDPANYTGQAGNTVVVNVGEDGLEFGAAPGGSFTSKCSVYRSTVQVISGTAFRKIQFATKDYDTDGEFDNITNYRFSPDTTGYYHVSAGVHIESPADGENLAISIYKNGTGWNQGVWGAGSIATCSRVISADMYLLDSDYIEVFAFHSASGNLNISGTNHITFLTVHRFA
ncbi:hypothetical protein LCGC14_0647900 [marine sediment metagenome]|uniref:Photosynthesis system II assembly factor Ycf48/Hcf136-like domain-containing protein n=1 Tax=marine sediment metagenome TaxID=412755 RepID=A0A0F9TIY0_9ZZZZ